MSSRRYTPRGPAAKPADAEAGAASVRKFMIGLFDKEDGRAANWPLIAETLFRAAFEALDEVPANTPRDALMRRVHDSAYNRLVGNEDTAPSGDPAAREEGAKPTPQPSRDFRP